MSREDLEKFEQEVLHDVVERMREDKNTDNAAKTIIGGEKMGTITETREMNAKKVVDFLNTLDIDTKEYTKVLGRAYRIVAKKE